MIAHRICPSAECLVCNMRRDIKVGEVTLEFCLLVAAELGARSPAAMSGTGEVLGLSLCDACAVIHDQAVESVAFAARSKAEEAPS